MADYWKSQPRKFCDFCKCWIADNKPSRDFHERGKRHQESVKNKISELRKKGLQDLKKEKDVEHWMVQMEKGAMKKLQQDLAADPSLAQQYGVTIKPRNDDVSMSSKGNVSNASTSKGKVADKSKSKEKFAFRTSKEEAAVDMPSSDDACEWVEALSPEGYVYYWNTKTKESRWELPGSESSDLIGAESKEEEDAAIKEEPHLSCDTDAKNSTSVDHLKEEISIKKVDRSVKDESKAEKVISGNAAEAKMTSSALSINEIENRKRPSHAVYGQWQEIKEESEPSFLDLELPVDPNRIEGGETKTFVLTPEPKLKFKEKKVESLGGTKMVGFKKRKLNSGAAKGNIRGNIHGNASYNNDQD